MGFGWSGANSKTDPKSTILENLKNQGQIKRRYACVKLHSEKSQPGGELLIGGCDVEAEHWGRVWGNGLWQIPIDKFAAIGTDGKSIASVCGAGSAVPNCQAVLDTGAAVLGKFHWLIRINKLNWIYALFQKGGPSYLVDPIATKLGAAQYDEERNDYYVDCDDKTLGNMEFTFGKFKVVLTPDDYLWRDGVSRIACEYIL